MTTPANIPAAATESAKREAVVQVNNVSRRFKTPTGQVVTALQGVDLHVYPGEFVSLIGPSGCGKSTLLRIVADLLPPSTGRVSVFGDDAHRARERRSFGFVFQTPLLFPWRTSLDNVALMLEIQGL